MSDMTPRDGHARPDHSEEPTLPAPVENSDSGTPSRDAATWLLYGLVALAVIASGTMLLTDRVLWMKVAVLMAVWAAFLGVVLVIRYRRQLEAERQRAGDLKRIYQLELTQEIAARREHELVVERAARQEISQSYQQQLAALRQEIDGLRQFLAANLDIDDGELPTLKARADRVGEITAAARVEAQQADDAPLLAEHTGPAPTLGVFPSSQQPAPQDIDDTDVLSVKELAAFEAAEAKRRKQQEEAARRAELAARERQEAEQARIAEREATAAHEAQRRQAAADAAAAREAARAAAQRRAEQEAEQARLVAEREEAERQEQTRRAAERAEQVRQEQLRRQQERLEAERQERAAREERARLAKLAEAEAAEREEAARREQEAAAQREAAARAADAERQRAAEAAAQREAAARAAQEQRQREAAARAEAARRAEQAAAAATSATDQDTAEEDDPLAFLPRLGKSAARPPRTPQRRTVFTPATVEEPVEDEDLYTGRHRSEAPGGRSVSELLADMKKRQQGS